MSKILKEPRIVAPTSPELVELYAKKLDITKEDALFLIKEFTRSFQEVFCYNGYVSINKIGKFYMSVHRYVEMKLPNGESVDIPLRYLIKFRPAISIDSMTKIKVKNNIVKVSQMKIGYYDGFYKTGSRYTDLNKEHNK